MPSQASSSDSNDLASKYSHLLQPIRDLTKNWDIDVAAQLEEYLAEVRINQYSVLLKLRENRFKGKIWKPMYLRCPLLSK